MFTCADSFRSLHSQLYCSHRSLGRLLDRRPRNQRRSNRSLSRNVWIVERTSHQGETVKHPENCSAAPQRTTAECRDGSYSFSQSRWGA